MASARSSRSLDAHLAAELTAVKGNERQRTKRTCSELTGGEKQT